MTIWCPECGSFQFKFNPISAEVKPTATEPQFAFKDNLVCMKCSNSFTIEWLEPERKWWMNTNIPSTRPKFNSNNNSRPSYNRTRTQNIPNV